MDQPPRVAVTYLFSRACPSHDEGLDLLRDAARAAAVDLDLTAIEVRTDAEAVEARFPGSPTYLLDGRDPFAPVAPEHDFQFDACRAYARPGGRIGPLPSRDDLVAALVLEGERMSLAIGDTAPSFRLPTTEGGTASLEDMTAATQAVVVAFWCNHCPYVRAWEDRFMDIARDYAPRGVATVAVCANDAVSHPGDSFEAMAERAAERGYPFPYARDDSQEVPRAYGAERTPEVFVIDGAGRLAYHGAIDDSTDAGAVTAHHLRAALDAVLGGEAPARAETPPVGCTIKWGRGA